MLYNIYPGLQQHLNKSSQLSSLLKLSNSRRQRFVGFVTKLLLEDKSGINIIAGFDFNCFEM